MHYEHEYQVALSFAGEDREYVSEVARHLQLYGISIFYDSFEEDKLWGEDLYVLLDNIYRKASLYCVMFISKAYAEKRWTNHERKSAQARDFINDNEGFILPARFDDTEIKGLRPTVGYIDLKNRSPRELALLIARKIGSPYIIFVQELLAQSIELARKYLQPQTLITSDIIAEEIRKTLKEIGPTLNNATLDPYFLSDLPENRIVGYIACQIAPFQEFETSVNLLFEKELEFAKLNNETRPMWQLLVAIGLWETDTVEDYYERETIGGSNYIYLPYLLEQLELFPSIDKGGQCKMKLKNIIKSRPELCRFDEYNYIWDKEFDIEPKFFVWKNGIKTSSYIGALKMIKFWPKIVEYHISQGHFLNWYSIKITVTSSLLDLNIAILAERVNNKKNI